MPAAARAAGNCTCDELRNYLQTVEKKRECYKQLYTAGQTQPYSNVGQQRTFMESCMGWVAGSAQPEGKASSATAEEKKSAREKCLQNHCTWICDESIDNVHEKYHDWFDSEVRAHVLVVLWRATQGTADSQMLQENSLSEIGAHDAEAWFLRDKIREAERNGECANVRKSVDAVERDRRIKDAADNVARYLTTIGGAP